MNRTVAYAATGGVVVALLLIGRAVFLPSTSTEVINVPSNAGAAPAPAASAPAASAHAVPAPGTRSAMPPGSAALKPPPAHGAPIKWGTSVSNAIATAKISGKPIVVDFYATWCGPCKILDGAYQLSPLAQELGNWITVKVDTDRDSVTARQYGATSLPTLVFLDSTGKEVGRQEGFAAPPKMSESELTAFVAKDTAATLRDKRNAMGRTTA
jgi:thiol-disulfide isomerase/thioredoxin